MSRAGRPHTSRGRRRRVTSPCIHGAPGGSEDCVAGDQSRGGVAGPQCPGPCTGYAPRFHSAERAASSRYAPTTRFSAFHVAIGQRMRNALSICRGYVVDGLQRAQERIQVCNVAVGEPRVEGGMERPGKGAGRRAAMPSRNARLRSSSVHVPMPVSRSGVMFVEWIRPRGVASEAAAGVSGAIVARMAADAVGGRGDVAATLDGGGRFVGRRAAERTPQGRSTASACRAYFSAAGFLTR